MLKTNSRLYPPSPQTVPQTNEPCAPSKANIKQFFFSFLFFSTFSLQERSERQRSTEEWIDQVQQQQQKCTRSQQVLQVNNFLFKKRNGRRIEGRTRVDNIEPLRTVVPPPPTIVLTLLFSHSLSTCSKREAWNGSRMSPTTRPLDKPIQNSWVYALSPLLLLLSFLSLLTKYSLETKGNGSWTHSACPVLWT